MIRRQAAVTRWDDRLPLWGIVGCLLAGYGGGMLLDALTPLDFARAFYRQATYPFSLLPLPWLGTWLLTGALAIGVSCSPWGGERLAFWGRVYALWVLGMVGWWYAAGGFVFGAMGVVVVVGWTLAGWRYQPRGGSPWRG